MIVQAFAVVVPKAGAPARLVRATAVPSLSDEVQRESTPFTWTKKAGTLSAHYRSDQAVPSRQSQATQATNERPILKRINWTMYENIAP
jgi:hypothetical protein